MSEVAQQAPYNFYYWHTANGPKERLDSIASDMAEFMLGRTEYGTYCHGGGDLLGDYMKFANLELDNEDYWNLSSLASDIIESYEASSCGICNDEGENDD